MVRRFGFSVTLRQGPRNAAGYLSVNVPRSTTYSVAEQKAAEYDSNLEKSGDPLIITEGDQTFSELFSLFFSKGVDRQGKPLNETTITSYVYGFNANVMPYLGKRKVKAGPLDITKGFLLKILSDCFGS